MNNCEHVTFTIFDKISKERPKLFLNSYCYYSIIYLSHTSYYQNEKLTSFHHKKEALLISRVRIILRRKTVDIGIR